MSDSYVRVAADSTGKKIQTFENTVGGNTVEAQAVVLVDETGTPYVPITSIPSYATAWVDPNGDDSTGTVGDMAKPFLTVQAALTAFENDPNGNGTGNYPEGPAAVIDIGNNNLSEHLTTSLTAIGFKGSNANRSHAFLTLSFTEPTQNVELGIYSCEFQSVTANTTGLFYSVLEVTESGSFTNTLGRISVQNDAGVSQAGDITANGSIVVYGFNYLGTLSAPGFGIYVSDCKPSFINAGNTSYNADLVIDSAGSTVYARNSIIGSVAACATLHLIDSRVIGTNNASSTVYADVLLAGDDTAYDATTWNGDTRTPTKNAVRDKFESLSIPVVSDTAYDATTWNANTDAPSKNAVRDKFESLGTASTLASDTDGTLAANSDSKIATQKATKTYVDSAVTGLFDFKGSTDASANPNYPAASKGDAYVVSVAGKIGGASGKSVDIGDVYVASADNAGGTEASVGTSWFVLEHNLVGALLAANNLSDLASASTARTNLGLGSLATQSGTFSGTSSGTNTGDQTAVSGNAGTATALQTARNIDGQSFDGTANITVIAPGTHAATGKTTPVDADEVPLVDSAASNVLKKLTWANLKATLKTYFDTLYPSGSGTSSGVNTGDQDLSGYALIAQTKAIASLRL